MVVGPGVRPLPRTIWYMGAKARVLRGILGEALEREARTGSTVVDLMTGTGSVAAFCARGRRVIANDAAHYSHAIARSLLEHHPAEKERFLRSVDLEEDLGAVRDQNLVALQDLYAAPLEREAELLARYQAGDHGDRWCREYRRFLAAPRSLYPAGRAPWRGLYAGAAGLLDEDSMARRRRDPRARPACLAAAYYANVYFGLRQAIAIDSLRAAIHALPERAPHAERKRVHYLSALLHAASLSTSGTSHFAQPRQLTKDSELHALARRRLIDVAALFAEFSRQVLGFVAATPHAAGNRCFRGDYRAFIEEAPGKRGTAGRSRFRFPAAPDLIYLDPPYTQDNYSRFYHVLDVLARYDYPPLERGPGGEVVRGRYPAIAARFQSDFCRRTRVEGEFRRVIGAAAGSGAKLVISYAFPTGLLFKEYLRAGRGDPVRRFADLCRQSYRRVEIEKLSLLHSGQGDSNLRAEEIVAVCRGSR